MSYSNHWTHRISNCPVVATALPMLIDQGVNCASVLGNSNCDGSSAFESKRSMRQRSKIYLCFVFLGLVSCQNLSEAFGFKPRLPIITVNDITIEKLGWPNLELRVNAKIQNPNFFELNLENLTYALRVGDIQIAAGEFLNPIIVNKRSFGDVSLPVKVNLTNAALNMAQLLQNKNIEMTFEASAFFKTVLGKFSVKTSEKKRIR